MAPTGGRITKAADLRSSVKAIVFLRRGSPAGCGTACPLPDQRFGRRNLSSAGSGQAVAHGPHIVHWAIARLVPFVPFPATIVRWTLIET
jgi:hypothetical protein